MNRYLATTFSLITLVLSFVTPLSAIHGRVTLENISYPAGQKSIVGIENGTLHNGLVVRITENGIPAAGKKIVFSIVHSSGQGSLIETPVVISDNEGIARTSFRFGNKEGSYIVEAFYEGKLDVPPLEIELKAYRQMWVFFLVLGMLGGLALFLYGMELSAEGLQKAAGDRMRNILGKLTNNTWMGILVGTLTTATIQSSSATTVMVIGFVSATLMTLKQAAGVIYGANIGTTLTVQLIAFNISEYAPLLIATGFFSMMLAGKKQVIRYSGIIILGFGLIFFGMGMMSSSMNPLRTIPAFTSTLASLGTNPVLGVFVAAVFTAIVQSSGAVIGISIALALQNLMTLPAAIAIAFGANIGTTATALLASLGAEREGKQTALLHFIFNTMGVLVFLPFMNLYTRFIGYIDQMFHVESISRSIANAHLFFNLINTLLFIPFTGPLTRLIEVWIPIKVAPKELFRPAFIAKEPKATQVALEQAYREILNMAEITGNLIELARNIFNGNLIELSGEIKKQAAKTAILSSALQEYLASISNRQLVTKEADEITYYLNLIENLNNLSDSISQEMMASLERHYENVTKLKEEHKQQLIIMLDRSRELFEKNLSAMREKTIAPAEEALLLYTKLKLLASSYQDQQLSSFVFWEKKQKARIDHFCFVAG